MIRTYNAWTGSASATLTAMTRTLGSTTAICQARRVYKGVMEHGIKEGGTAKAWLRSGAIAEG